MQTEETKGRERDGWWEKRLKEKEAKRSERERP